MAIQLLLWATYALGTVGHVLFPENSQAVEETGVMPPGANACKLAAPKGRYVDLSLGFSSSRGSYGPSVGKLKAGM
jgi:hypothetical protein